MPRIYKHDQLIILIEVSVETKDKPHLKLTHQGWHAKVSHLWMGLPCQSNAIGKTPKEAIDSLNEFLLKQTEF